MPSPNIIVIGASAGGVQVLAELARGLPADLDAALFVSIHIPPNAPSGLPAILNREGPLRAVHAIDGEPIRHGTIYIAPPDRHLLIHPGRIRLGRGPRENGHRPAVDPLFRSAAAVYGPRTIGVVITGNLSDGTAGMADIKRLGGTAVVQDPRDAVFDGMPRSVLDNVPDVDHVTKASKLASLLVQLVQESSQVEQEDDAVDEAFKDVAEGGPSPLGGGDEREGAPSVFGCPDCGGVLWEMADGRLARYRCRVGHAFTGESLLDAQTEGLELALWTAYRTLREMEQQSHNLAGRMGERGNSRAADRLHERAHDASRRAGVIRSVLVEDRHVSDDSAADVSRDAARGAAG